MRSCVDGIRSSVFLQFRIGIRSFGLFGFGESHSNDRRTTLARSERLIIIRRCQTTIRSSRIGGISGLQRFEFSDHVELGPFGLDQIIGNQHAGFRIDPDIRRSVGGMFELRFLTRPAVTGGATHLRYRVNRIQMRDQIQIRMRQLCATCGKFLPAIFACSLIVFRYEEIPIDIKQSALFLLRTEIKESPPQRARIFGKRSVPIFPITLPLHRLNERKHVMQFVVVCDFRISA